MDDIRPNDLINFVERDPKTSASGMSKVMVIESCEDVTRMALADGVELAQVSAGKWDVLSAFVQDGPWLVDYLKTGVALRSTSIRPQSDFAFVILFPNDASVLHKGVKLPLEHLFFRSDAFMTDDVLEAGTRGMSLRANREFFCSEILPLFPQNIQQSFDIGAGIFHVPESMQSDIIAWFEHIENCLLNQNFNGLEPQKAIMQLVEMLVDIAQSNEEDTPLEELHEVGTFRMVRMIEEFAANCHDEVPTLPDLCRAAKCSQRSLHNALVKHLGLSPYRYLQTLRLNGARRDLLAARASVNHGDITRIAMKWGFWHFGRFSNDYKKFFGELPSQTIR